MAGEQVQYQIFTWTNNVSSFSDNHRRCERCSNVLRVYDYLAMRRSWRSFRREIDQHNQTALLSPGGSCVAFSDLALRHQASRRMNLVHHHLFWLD